MAEGWKQENTDELIRLWNEGYSAGQLGMKFGVTRSAITGKVKRLRDSGVDMRKVALSQQKDHIRKIKKVHRKNPFKPGSSIPPKIRELPTATQESCNKTFLELEPGDCKYPVGETTYCARTSEGSYCEIHRLIVYQKA